MEHSFETRLRAAVVAGWWTVLIAGIAISLQWFALLGIMNVRPEWMLALWGPGATWELMYQVALWAFAFLKMCVLLFVMFLTWLTLWSRRLSSLK